MRPPALILGALHFVGIPDIFVHFRIITRNAFGIITADEKNYIPEKERPKAIFWARLHISVYALAVGLALIYGSILPLILIGGPRIYGAWHMVMTGLLQHGALDEDVLDHRLNSRTVNMNPISRWIYWNMNYHIEHHMFPMVPYHALPKLHALIRDDLPPPNHSIVDGYREMIGALWRQRSNPSYRLRRYLPATARPYREEFHDVEVAREKQQA